MIRVTPAAAAIAPFTPRYVVMPVSAYSYAHRNGDNALVGGFASGEQKIGARCRVGTVVLVRNLVMARLFFTDMRLIADDGFSHGRTASARAALAC